MVEARTRAAGVLLFIALGVALLLLFSTGRLQVAGEFTRWLVAPLEVRLSRGGQAIRLFLTGSSDVEALRAENARLQAEINRLTIEQVRFTEIEQENRRLRALLNFVEPYPHYTVRGASVVGQVIGWDPATVIQVLIINVGEAHGIRAGMPVVTDTGLVGRVLRVHKTTTEVLPITSPQSAVNAIVQSSRLTGIVRGQHDETVVMEYIPLDTPVKVGDLVLTSGLGGVFPPKLVIGQVTAVERHDYAMFQQATIRPTVDFRRLEQVLVLTTFTPNLEVQEILQQYQESNTKP